MNRINWTLTIERYLREGRPVSGGCGPSSAMKNLNTQVQNLSQTMTNEAKTVFGAASSVFNNLISPLQQIVNGGPGQAGFSASEMNARNAAAVQSGATTARNLAGAAASSAAAIGGGNTVMPAGGTQAAVLAAKTAAAEQTAQQENEIQTESATAGRGNFWNAVGEEKNLPNVFTPANDFNKNAAAEQAAAQTSQQNMDTQSGWWKPIVQKAAAGAASFIPGVGPILSAALGGAPLGSSSPAPKTQETMSLGGWANDMTTIGAQGPPTESTSSLPDVIPFDKYNQ